MILFIRTYDRVWKKIKEIMQQSFNEGKSLWEKEVQRRFMYPVANLVVENEGDTTTLVGSKTNM